jgi:hypothetical protein
MYNFDIIKKLEMIKHNHLIYALEKYTDQITAEDIKKRELERQNQDKLTKTEVKKPDDDIKKPVDDVKKPVDDVKKPVDDVKKPIDDVKKFENNIMDSLKWVFISIGILIFLIFIGGLIYWGLYGGNYDEHNTRIIEDKYIEPTNQSNKSNQYIEPINQSNKSNQYIEPTNQSNKSNQYIEPINQSNKSNQYIEPINQSNKSNQYIEPINQSNKSNQYIEPTNQTNKSNQYIEPTNVENKEGSIFSFLLNGDKKEKISEIEPIQKTKAQLEAEEYLESIKKSITKQQLDNSGKSSLESIQKTKAQLDADEYLESIKKQQLETKNIKKDDNQSVLLSSSIKDNNNLRIQKE